MAACAQAGCRYQRDNYCCAGSLGTTVKSYPSAWYAFDWGSSRFYVLEGAWSDTYGGYQGDFQGHFNGPVAGCQYCGAELTWLTSDLATHSNAHKFAFWHYPLYSDSGSQTSDTYLQGPQALEGVLASYGVNIVFNGHAHQYERNYPQIAGSPMLSYITGGGGDPLGGVSSHSSFDAYSQAVYHYLRVTVSGSSVTVTPTDENGATFDVQTFNFPAQTGGNDFSVATSPSTVSVVQGQSATSTVSTALVSGSPQTVTLSASGLPAGATASFNPGAVTAGGSSTLTLTTSTSTPAGGYTVTVTATGTSATHTASITLTVTAQSDFSISASPAGVSVAQGQSTTANITTAVVSGSAQAVTLGVSGLPSGATATFSPSTVTAGGSSTMTVSTTSSTPGGSYTLTVTGTGASATHATTLSLTVTVANDFSISTNPAALTVLRGQSTATTVSTAVVGGSAQTVTLGASGLPAGATASFNPSTVTAGASSTMTVSTTPSSPGGTYALTVTGTGTSATHTTSVSLTVTLPDDFSISASPAGVSVVQGQSTTSTIATAIVSGSAQTVTLSASGVPAGATVSFNPSSVTSGGSSTLTISASTSTAAGGYAVTVTGTGTSATHSTTISLSVSSPSSGPSLVQAAGATESASSTALTATFSVPTQPGHLLVLSASVYTGLTNQITKVTDSAGNSWTRIGAFCTSGHYSDGELWYAANSAGVTSVTVTVATATVMAIEVAEFSGVAAVNPLDGFAGTSNTGTAANSGAAIPSGSTDLAVAFIAGHGSSQSISVTSAGFSTQPQQSSTNAGASPATVISAYVVLSSTAAQDFSGGFSSTMYWASGIALFKSA